MKYDKLSKEVLAVIKPPIWNSYFYVNLLLRKAYERTIPKLLIGENKYKILDYGCGVRPYEYLFENNINKYIGVDVGINNRADLSILPGQKLPVPDSEFDFVLSSQVLEHVEDVDQYMNECNRILKDNGTLLLSTHGTWQFHASPYDYNRWTRMGLNVLIKKHGFEVIETVPILGQLALTSQLRLSFFHSFAGIAGVLGKLILLPISFLYQFKMILEDFITPQRVKERDSAVFLMVCKKVKIK